MQIKTLKLSFKDAKGKTKMVSIDHPKADLNDQGGNDKFKSSPNKRRKNKLNKQGLYGKHIKR